MQHPSEIYNTLVYSITFLEKKDRKLRPQFPNLLRILKGSLVFLRHLEGNILQGIDLEETFRSSKFNKSLIFKRMQSSYFPTVNPN